MGREAAGSGRGREEAEAETMQAGEAERMALLSDNFLIPNSHEPQLGCLPLCSEKSHLFPISSFLCLSTWSRFLFFEAKGALLIHLCPPPPSRYCETL